MSVGDVCNYVPDHQRQHFRKLRGAERLSSMGFPTSLRLQLLSDTTFATGNAYPVQFMVAVLPPMLAALGRTSPITWPPLHLKLPICLAVVEAALQRTPKKLIMAKKKAKAKARAKTTLKRQSPTLPTVVG
jgi:hypothetical protein